jgi:uncharacterized protein (DUF1800 family)
MLFSRAEIHRGFGEPIEGESMKALAKMVALSAVLFGRVVLADVHDDLFTGHFDIPPDAPANAGAAARFLTQATFGPTQADINYLMAQGYGEWINEQLSKPATLSEPTVAAVVNALTAGGQQVGQTQRLNRWFWQAAYAPDQLRQRMAFALSQIFVISDQSSNISGQVVPMAAYQDVLANDAFASYRKLLGDVTYNPTMGQYLNAFHNVKPGITTLPDENYAREVMQLFSIGLIEVDSTFTPILSGGLPVPTYDQNVILSTAKVFTGFTYSDAPIGTGPTFTGANFYGGGLSFAGQSNPMACWGTELFPYSSGDMLHDITGDDGTLETPKTVLGGATIPPGHECSQDVTDELDIIAAHANVAPFISRQLIQRFVTSNPSTAYIGRVSQVFTSSGGDLGDVIFAILTDTEARNPPALVSGDSYGKLREPVLRLTAVWRAFDATPPAATRYGEVVMTGGNNFLGSFGQGPLESPTVFNFYTPDFQQPGTFADNNLFSPEFQITNESTMYSTANLYYGYTEGAYQGMTSPPITKPLISLASLIPNNVVNATTIVNVINANMLYGTMSSATQAALTTMVQGLSGATASEIAWSAIYVTMISPDFATQR